MMNPLLIGNLISGIGCLLMVAVGFLRKKNQILAVQCVQFSFMGFGNLILGGTSGFIANIVSIIRNLIFVKCRTTVGLKLFFIALQILLSLGALNGGFICWLPILAAALYTWFLDTASDVQLKIIILTTQVMWLVYDLYYQNYVASIFDLMTMGSNLVGLRMVLKQGT